MSKMNKNHRKFFLIIILIITIFLSSCVNLKNSENYIKLVISEYNSGPTVEGANVKIYCGNALLEEATTNKEGIVTFSKTIQIGKPYTIVISKPFHAKTVIDIERLQSSLTINTTLRKANFIQNVENNMNIIYSIYDSEQKKIKYTPNEGGIYTIFSTSSIFIEAQSTSSDIPISHMYAKIGTPPGAEFLTSPRLYSESSRLSGNIETTGFYGKTYLFIDCYDVNDNRYEKIIPIYFSDSVNLKLKPYIVEPQKPALYAYTIRSETKYYNFSQNLEKLESLDVGLNAYIKVSWKKWEESTQNLITDKPYGYAIYRSYDGKNFEKIAVVSDRENSYIDTSPTNRFGKRVWYAVASVYKFLEGSKNIVGSVVLLPSFKMTNVKPYDGETNVSVTPEFSWKFEGLEDFEGIKYKYEIWLYDWTVNKKHYYYPVDSSNNRIIFKTKNPEVNIKFEDYKWKGLDENKLQSNKPYEWAPELLAAILEDDKNNSIAVSIVCDYNGIISPVLIPPEKYYLFITGN